MDTVDFGARIREARERLGISQEELAHRLNKNQRAISQYENGQRRLFAVDLPELARVLGVPVSYFFDGELQQDELDGAILAEFRRLQSNEAKTTLVQVVRLLCDLMNKVK